MIGKRRQFSPTVFLVIVNTTIFLVQAVIPGLKSLPVGSVCTQRARDRGRPMVAASDPCLSAWERPGLLLPAVLEREEGEVREPRHIALDRPDSEDAAHV